jgi:hypothetical protein
MCRNETAFELYFKWETRPFDRARSESIGAYFEEGSSAIGSTSTIKHYIDTGASRPIKKTPFRIQHALKPVAEEHTDDMLQEGIIEPSNLLVSVKRGDRRIH